MGNCKMLPKFTLPFYLKRFMLAFLNLVTRIIQELDRWQFKNRIPFQHVVSCEPINYNDPTVSFCKSRAEVRSSISFVNSFKCLSK